MYELPKSVEVNGTEYKIRSDYRAALDICTALSDNDLEDVDKANVILDIFYPAFSGYEVNRDGETETILMPPEDYQEAIRKCFWFIDCGDEEVPTRKSPKLMDWEQDFKYIVAPINRVCGQEVRSAEYMHWWTFVSAYYEIGGDCLFAQIVRIREKLAEHKSLDKSDLEFYRKNRSMVDLKVNYSAQEQEVLNQWIK